MIRIISMIVCAWFVTGVAAAERAKTIATQDFYDGLRVTVEYDGGVYRALVSQEEGEPNKLGLRPAGTVLARYKLDTVNLSGTWEVFGSPTLAGTSKRFDYRAASLPESAQSLVAKHDVRSVAIAALLLWEETIDEAQSVRLDSLFVPEVLQRGTNPNCQTGCIDCPACTPTPNGCSPSWITPQSCAGTSIVPACTFHDSCYQCGSVCEGRGRQWCDQQLRNDIRATTGSWWCASVYYWGVRLLGWTAYQDPTQHPNLGPDAYSLGIQISACEGQYAHMCTVFVM